MASEWVNLATWSAAQAASQAADTDNTSPDPTELAAVSEESLQRICAHFIGVRRPPHKGFHR
jgi:hypothetical protein